MNNNYTEEVFESIKHINEYGQEFWYAREFQKVLEYTEWRKFYGVIEKAKTACSQSTNNANDHFVDVDKIVHLGVADRKIFVKSLQDKEEYNEVWIENTEFEEVNQCKNNGKGKKSGEEGSDSWIWKEGYWAITPKKGNQE